MLIKKKIKIKKNKIKIILIIFIVIFSLIPLIIDIIEFIQRIQKNYEMRVSLVAQIVSYILLIPFSIYLYKHHEDNPDSGPNCFFCIGASAGTIMFCTMMMDIFYTIDSDGVKKYDNSMKILNTSRIIFFVIAIVYDLAIGEYLYHHLD